MKVSKVAFIVVFALVLQTTLIPYLVGNGAVSYTHLTLPTKRIV